MELFNQKKLTEVYEVLENYFNICKANYPMLKKETVFDVQADHKVLNLDFMIEELSQQSLDQTLKLELLTDLLYTGETLFKGIKNEIIQTIFDGYELTSKQLGNLFSSYVFLTSEEKEIVQNWINTDYRMDIDEIKTKSNEGEHPVGFLHETENDIWLCSSFL